MTVFTACSSTFVPAAGRERSLTLSSARKTIFSAVVFLLRCMTRLINCVTSWFSYTASESTGLGWNFAHGAQELFLAPYFEAALLAIGNA